MILSLGALSSGTLIVNALGLLIAQSIGAGANQYIFIVLTSLSALSGANIAANEIVAIRLASDRVTPSKDIILAIGAVCTIFAFLGLGASYNSGYTIDQQEAIIVSLCGGTYSMLSFVAANMYYRRLLDAKAGPTTRSKSFLYGVTGNGVLQLCIIAIALSVDSIEMSHLFVCLAIAAPPAAQILCMKAVWHANSYRAKRIIGHSRSITVSRLIRYAILLSLLSQALTLLKGIISTEASSFQNIVFFGVSLLATTAAIVYKSMFFSNTADSRSWKRIRRWLYTIVAALAFACLAFREINNMWAWCSIIFLSILIPTCTEVFRRQA